MLVAELILPAGPSSNRPVTSGCFYIIETIIQLAVVRIILGSRKEVGLTCQKPREVLLRLGFGHQCPKFMTCGSPNCLVEASRAPDPGLPQNLGGQMPSRPPESTPQLHNPLPESLTELEPDSASPQPTVGPGSSGSLACHPIGRPTSIMDNSLRGQSKIRKRAAKACLACRARKVGLFGTSRSTLSH